MKANFDASMRQILKHEGGYVDHPRDPGGATNLGITIGTLSEFRRRKVTKAEVKALTVTEAIDIYRSRYAGVIQYDSLPSGLDHVTLDPAINSGPSRGAKWLQKALGVKADGQIGKETLTKARSTNVPKTIQAACAARMGFLRGLKTWGTFGKGWSRRVAEVEAFSMKLAVGVQTYEDLAPLEAAKAQKKATVEKQSTAVPAGGAAAGGYSLDSIPQEVIVIVALAAVAVVVMLLGQARHNANRAAAYKALMENQNA
jgi:lysozyme family protein